MSSFVPVIDLLEITDCQCHTRGSPAGNIDEMYCLRTEREREIRRYRWYAIWIMRKSQWYRVRSNKWTSLPHHCSHFWTPLSEVWAILWASFLGLHFRYKCSSPHHLRGALNHHDHSPHRRNELKWSVYWKCSLQPQRTLAGHWLIKANLCSWCVF